MAKLDLASSEWCQLIFEGKNQAYGAYRMRANSPRRHTIAMLIVVAIAIVGFTIPTLLKLATPEQKEVMTEVTTLSKLAEPEIKQEEMKRVEPVAPPPPALKSSIKFTAPVIKKDEEVHEDNEIKSHKLLREISEDFLEWSRPYGYDVEWYYLGTGMFRCVMNQRIKDQAEDFAERINEKLKKGYKYNDMFINLLPIICITRCPQDIEDVDSVMRFGGELAEHEYTGRVLYARDIYNKERYDLMRDMDMILDKAFAENRFEVYYQPIYSIDSGKYNSAEALLRLNDDMYGYISPEIFIPAAEENGMIHKIGKFVLEEVCRFITGEKFKNLGLEYVEVNLSVIQCMSSELSEDVRAVMERYGVSNEQINLEITETAAAYAQTTIMDNINSLTDYGIAFSLDDFGTGYSNMKRIASMPFAIVKLDKTFADIDTDDKMMKVVKNTISMVKDMNMKIVVEGVETEESLREFSNLGVNYIQGYYFSRPLPQDKFISEVKRVNQS